MRVYLVILSILFSISCLSCSLQTGKALDSSTVALIKRGATTKEQVISMFGPPDSSQMVSQSDNGSAAISAFSKYINQANPNGTSMSKQLEEMQNVPVEYLFWNHRQRPLFPGASAISGERYANHTQNLMVSFDSKGIVVNYSFNSGGLLNETLAK